ncbi:NHL repeat-containing protein [Chitinophaga jiangningensis]|uniref:NHL repeat-containing protein n=1 Tax=Chitinophaga jiangningensis TaxID=1419482 RepID=A0A1M7LTA1_9BACT|nr:IPT/TIG domain-containing protein [Chitinophaga jiangningensis]SHM81458.1 NHL repeat-containing protein [Chitinophaga jiangningensis]
MTKYYYTLLLILLVLIAGCKKEDSQQHLGGSAMTIDRFLPQSGGATTQILITGSNFAADTSEVSVTINGKRCVVINTAVNQLMAIVPKRCGSGKVIVRVGSDSIVSTETFNYIFTRTVTTIAGNGKAGYANGKGTEAMFNFNGEGWYRGAGIVTDNDLNVYVTDVGNHCIRKIDTAGNVTLLAGNPEAGGYADGKGKSAKFSIPYGITIDAQANLYTVDPGNWDIRRITPDGEATTVAWAMSEPWFITTDPSSGQLYYTSAAPGATLYRLNADYSQTSVITQLPKPGGITFDKQGNLFITCNDEHYIQKYTAISWTAASWAGQKGVAGYADGAAASAKFSAPWSIAADAQGNLYVAGNGNINAGANPDQSIRFISATDAAVSTYAGGGSAGFSNGIGQAAAFNGPLGITIDKNGAVYVLDKNNNAIRKVISE